MAKTNASFRPSLSKGQVLRKFPNVPREDLLFYMNDAERAQFLAMDGLPKDEDECHEVKLQILYNLATGSMDDMRELFANLGVCGSMELNAVGAKVLARAERNLAKGEPEATALKGGINNHSLPLEDALHRHIGLWDRFVVYRKASNTLVHSFLGALGGVGGTAMYALYKSEGRFGK